MGPLDLKQILEVKKGDDETISTKRWNYLTAGNREIIIHREIIFKKKKKKEKKTLWLLFMDGVQLSRDYRAYTKRQLTFYH